MGPDPAIAAVRRAVRFHLVAVAARAAEPQVGAAAEPRVGAAAEPRVGAAAEPRVGAAAEPLVLVACSGGADSLALAAATAFEAHRAGMRAGAVTVDHGLQEGSAERAAAVAAVMRDLGLAPVQVRSVTVGGSGGPEAAARAARYAALGAAADDAAAAAVLLGHSRDDQAETVLLGLARGSGARSLAGMAAVSGPGGRWRRPLLGLARSTLSRACAAADLTPWEDPHNADPAHARVRVRTRVLPVLERELGDGRDGRDGRDERDRRDGRGGAVAAALARTAGLLREDADALDGWARGVAATATAGDGTLDVAALAAVPPAVRRRVLRGAALAAGCPATDLSAGHVAELDRLVTGWRGQGPLHLPGGVEAGRRCGRVTVVARPARGEA